MRNRFATPLLVSFLALFLLSFATPADSAPQSCLPNPLPGPVAPVFTFEAQRGSNERMRLDIWRVPCDGGHALLVRVTPLTVGPFLCSGSFDVIQGDIQYGLNFTDFATLTSFCDDLLTTRTFNMRPNVPPFNPSGAMKLAFDPVTTTTVFFDIPAASGPPPAGPPTLTVHPLGCTTCRPGQTLGFELHVTNPGAPMLVELKAGARLPGGSVVSILGRHEEELLPAGVTVIPLFSGFVLPGGIIPAGAYAIEAALLEPELGVTISRHSVALTLQP